MNDASPAPSFRRMLCKPRCPACGVGRLFDGPLQFKPRCEACGFSLAEHDIGDGPAYFVVMALSLVVTMMGVWVEFAFAPPLWLHGILWTPVIIAGTIWGIRAGKILFLAGQYRWRRDAMEENHHGDA